MLILPIFQKTSKRPLLQPINFFAREMEEPVLYEPSTAEIGDCSDQGAEGKTLLLLNSACNPIIGARVNLRRENGSYITNAKTDANGVADFFAVDLSTSPSRLKSITMARNIRPK
jgi:hypothetical protein